MPEIYLPDLPFELSKTTAQLQKKLRAKIDALGDAWAKFSAECNMIAGGDAADDGQSLGERAQALTQTRLNLITEEVQLRKQLPEFFKSARKDQTDATTAAADQIPTIREELKRKLLEAGYVDGNIPGTEIQCIQAVFFIHHPALREATLRYDSLLHDGSIYEAQRSNDDQIAELLKELAKLRAKILNGAGAL